MNKKSVKNGYFFQPSFLLKNRHIQSTLASLQLRVRQDKRILETSQEMIIQTSSGSRLLAYISQHPQAKGSIIIIHGWEGSSSSAYVIAAGAFFYRLGYSICRLNLRDHGESHHLNEGLFHGALLDETFEAVNTLARNNPDLPAYLIGFSMGANFSLRIAMKHTHLPIENLKHVFAISPPLDPYKTTLVIDHGFFFYRKYFLNKWKKSLIKKQFFFPNKYDFTNMLKATTCMELTEDIMMYFPELISYRDYFNQYTLKNDHFFDLKVPVRIYLAADDPVIPLEDFHSIRENDFLKLTIEKFGGHCGFIDIFPYRCWYNERIYDIIKE